MSLVTTPMDTIIALLPASPSPLPVIPLPVYPTPTYIFIETLEDANNHLRTIEDGAIIGLDLEAMEISHPKLTKGDKRKKLKQEIEGASTFSIDWSKVDVCVAQIAKLDNTVYVIHIRKIGDLPSEFVRICTSPRILKVSAGIFCDGQRLWDSFRLDLLSVASLGLFAKLAYPERIHCGLPYGNEPALAIVVECALGYKLEKGLRNSLWGAMPLSEAQKDYAAADAHATIASYRAVELELENSGSTIDQKWFTYDVVNRTRVKQGSTGRWKAECPWWTVEGVFLGRT